MSAQGHFEDVVLDARFHGFAQLGLDLEEPIGRAKSLDTLMRTAVIVIPDPEFDPFAGRFKTLELSALKELLPDSGPEAFDFAQGHRMMRAGFEMSDAVLLQFGFKARSAAPGSVLSAVVGEHLFRRLELSDTLTIDFDDGVSGGAAEQISRGDKTRIVIQESDEISVAATEAESENIRLPHLIGSGAFKEARAGEITAFGWRSRVDERSVLQTLPNGLGAGAEKEDAAQPLRDAFCSEGRIEIFDLEDLLGNGWRQLGLPGMRAGWLILQACFTQLPILTDPAVERSNGDVQLGGDETASEALFEKELDGSQFEIAGVAVGGFWAARPTPPRGGGAVLLSI